MSISKSKRSHGVITRLTKIEPFVQLDSIVKDETSNGIAYTSRAAEEEEEERRKIRSDFLFITKLEFIAEKNHSLRVQFTTLIVGRDANLCKVTISSHLNIMFCLNKMSSLNCTFWNKSCTSPRFCTIRNSYCFICSNFSTIWRSK